MKTTLEFIADLKAKHGIESDYAAAKLLGVSKMTLSSYRNGKSMLGDEVALKVAELLDLDPAYVVACIHAEREKNSTLKKLWQRIANEHFAVAAALSFIAVSLVALDIMPSPLFGSEGSMALAFAGFTKSAAYTLCEFGIIDWTIVATVAALLFYAFPRHNPRPEKEPNPPAAH